MTQATTVTEDYLRAKMEEGGVSPDEARETAAMLAVIARAQAKYGDRALGPVGRAMLAGRNFPLEGFDFPHYSPSADACQALMIVRRVVDIAKRHLAESTFHNEDGHLSRELHQEIADAGLFTFRMPKAYGGLELSVREYLRAVGYLAMQPRPVRSLAVRLMAVCGIGGQGPCFVSGDPELIDEETKARLEALLEKYAERWMHEGLSFLGMTERFCGSDLRRIRTSYVEDPEDPNYILITGEKMWTTGMMLGAVGGLLVRNGKKLSIVIVEIPRTPEECVAAGIEFIDYDLRVFEDVENRGSVFTNFRVPKENIIPGDGVGVGVDQLRVGRTGIAVMSEAEIRDWIRSSFPWTDLRIVFRSRLIESPMIRERLAIMVASMLGGQAWADYLSHLCDEQYAAELECAIGKVAATDLSWQAWQLAARMRGGRTANTEDDIGAAALGTFMRTIFEGENDAMRMRTVGLAIEMLTAKFLKPLEDKLKSKGVEDATAVGNIEALLKAPRQAIRLGLWLEGSKRFSAVIPELEGMPSELRSQVEFAVGVFRKTLASLVEQLRVHGPGYAKEQSRMLRVADKLISALTIIVSCCWARHLSRTHQLGIEVLCWMLREQKLKEEPTDRYYECVRALSETFVVAWQGGDVDLFTQWFGDAQVADVPFSYEREEK